MNDTERSIMGKNFIGIEELAKTPLAEIVGGITEPPVSFSADTLKKYAATHILIFTPVSSLTIVAMRERFGTDPAHEPCMYTQDWYLKEDFATKTKLDGRWHLVRKTVLEDQRAKAPEDIAKKLSGEAFPTAVTATFTFFAWWFQAGEKLWEHDFLWCSDVDHNGDRIYVGRYTDPDGVNKNGFNIHRFLSIRSAYSAAPEIL